MENSHTSLLCHMGFSRQEYWNGVPFPSPGESSQSRDWTRVSRITGRFFTTCVTREAPKGELILIKQYAIKRIRLITFCQPIIKLRWNEQTVISLTDTQNDWVRKTTYKDKGRPRRVIQVILTNHPRNRSFQFYTLSFR